ncbi:MAG TPA: YlxR family protein [Polyangia bacterium]|jgi:predicted RNA-binding protein YlxR (DUF448 family)|nr:YlxR family protein [Polyangia bacterium]
MATLPLRTCVGCRAIAPAAELVRLVLLDGRLARWSPKSVRPTGRGASIHGRIDCVRRAVHAGGFARAFRTRVEHLDPGEILQMLTAVTVRETP